MVVCFVYVYAFVCVLAHTFAEVRGQLAPMGSWDHTLVIGLGSKHLYPLSHLTSLVYFKLFLYYWESNPGPRELLGLQAYAIRSRLPSFLN